MSQKLKNLLKTKKPVFLFFVLFFIFLGIIVPRQQAFAQLGPILDIAEKTLKVLANFIIGGALQVLAAIGNVILGIASAILTWVTSPDFIDLSYTNPSDNFILDIGWKITRDLTNIGFVVILIIIGLATALRIKDYQWQRLLPKLIAVILLVNFTPVIAGVVVDSSNILMNNLLRDSANSTRTISWDNFKADWGTWEKNLKGNEENVFRNITSHDSLDFLGTSMALVVYSFLTAAILFVFSVLFVMRYIAIWILVILSPLAFFAWVLPGTKKYFSQWWQQFLQWSFIGATTAFFLYLSHQILVRVSDLKITQTAKTFAAKGVISGALPYFVVVVFMYIGFFVSLKSSAMGANTIIGWAKRREKTAGKWMGRKARRGAQVIMGEKWKRLAERMAGAKGSVLSRVLTSPLRPIGRGMMSLREAERKDAAKAEDEAKKKEKDAGRNVAEARKQILLKEWGKVGGTFAGMVEQKQVKEAIEKLGVKPKEVANAIKGLIGINEKDRAEKLYRGFSEYLLKAGYTPEDLGMELTEESDKKKYEPYAKLKIGEKEIESAYAAKLIAEASSPDEIKQLKGITSEESVQKVIHKFWTGNQFRKAGEEIGISFIEAVQDNIQTPHWYEKENPAAYRYFRSPGGQTLGIGFPQAVGDYDVDKQPTEHITSTIKKLETKMFKMSAEELKTTMGQELQTKVSELRRELDKRKKEEKEEKAKKEAEKKVEATKAEAEKEKKPKGPRRKRGTIID